MFYYILTQIMVKSSLPVTHRRIAVVKYWDGTQFSSYRTNQFPAFQVNTTCTIF